MDQIRTKADFNLAIKALQAIDWAQAFLPLVRAQRHGESRAAVFGALCVYYARPFKNSRRLGRLQADFVPSPLRMLHEKLLLHRDKSLAHTDADHVQDGTVVNGVFFRSNGRKVVVENRYQSPTPEFLAEVEQLLTEVREQLNAVITKCLNEGPPSKHRCPAGLYRLDLGINTPWLIRVGDDGLGSE